jgi:two-component system KDP operon response regulator KdpE
VSEHAHHIVVIEDEADIRRFICAVLEEDGYRVHEARDVAQGKAVLETTKPDLAILDLGLPDGEGTEVIRALRDWSPTPVIVLSARSAELEKIEALDAGADDYLTKPFGVGELRARVRAMLRRRQALDARTIVELGEVRVDLGRRLVERAGTPVHLTQIEYRLLTALIANADKVLTQRQLLKQVWGPSYVESGHYLRIYVSHLRRKLEVDAARPRYLLTETGIGYRLRLDFPSSERDTE